jgi:hypothetical protein
VNVQGSRDVGALPASVRRFVLDRLDSVPQLEGLLLVRSDPCPTWDARSFANRLYIGVEEAQAALESLHHHDLMTRNGSTFAYAPGSDALRREVDALALAYPRFLIPLTDLIHGKARRGN